VGRRSRDDRQSDDNLPESLVAYAERRIKAAITEGTIPPGSRLSAQKLAAEFGLSHIPIREALTALAASGWVVHDRGRGFFARELSSEDLLDIYHWRAVLEREALIMAVPKLTDDDIAEMKHLQDQMAEHLSSEDRLKYLELNRQFHFVPFRRAGSRRLVRMLNYLWDSAQPYTSLGESDSTKGYKEHIKLIQLLAKKDTEGAIRAIDAHRRVRTDVVARWEAERKR
jgi:Transcriptional regulators